MQQDNGYNNLRKDQSKPTWILSIYLHPLVDLIFRLSLLIENLDIFSPGSTITVTENVTFDPNFLVSIYEWPLFNISLKLVRIHSLFIPWFVAFNLKNLDEKMQLPTKVVTK